MHSFGYFFIEAIRKLLIPCVLNNVFYVNKVALLDPSGHVVRLIGRSGVVNYSFKRNSNEKYEEKSPNSKS